MTITFLAPDGVAITAQQFRQAQAATHGGGSGRRLGGRSGFRIDTPSTVLTATSTTWTLTPCAAMIDPGASTHQGMYGWSTDANVTGTVTAADATYARKDIVYIQINDSSAGDGSGALTAPVLYLAGTASASPAAPALPARSFLVGTISVPVAGGGSPTVVLNPARYAAAGAVLPVGSTGDKATITAPYVGMEIQRLDLTQVSPAGVRERWNGTTWDHFGHSEWTYNNGAGTIPSGTIWGTGVMTLDTAPTTDSNFVTYPAFDSLTLRDAGLYSVTLTGTATTTATGRSWLEIWDGTNFYARTPFNTGENGTSVSIPNLRVAANTTIKFAIFMTCGATFSYSGRVRVTRIA